MVSNTKFVNAIIKEIKRYYQICKYVSLCWRDRIDWWMIKIRIFHVLQHTLRCLKDKIRIMDVHLNENSDNRYSVVAIIKIFYDPISQG